VSLLKTEAMSPRSASRRTLRLEPWASLFLSNGSSEFRHAHREEWAFEDAPMGNVTARSYALDQLPSLNVTRNGVAGSMLKTEDSTLAP